MTNGENQRLGAYVETSTGGERVRAYTPAPLPPRLNRHSTHSYHDGNDMDEGEEVDGSAVVSCGEASEVLHFIEASLDPVPHAVDGGVMREGMLSGRV